MKKIIVISLFLILALGYFFSNHHKEAIFDDEYNSKKKLLLSEIKKEDNIVKNNIEKINIISNTYAKEESIKIKESINLEVDFFPQSPFGEWGDIFNETCEEASALIAINYIRQNTINRKDFRDELLKIVKWENKRFGDYRHTDVKQTSQILEEYFKFSDFEIIENPSIIDIKKNLNSGNIIIAPFYGVGLNPHYSGKGPEYHFMVIKGYNKDSFITHDVGTKHGKNYKYNQKELLDRLHDYDSISIRNGKKRLIILKK